MITLKNVSKNIVRDNVEKNVLNNINIQLGDTGLVVLRGGENSGKTYLLRILSQIDNISSGNMFVDGVDIGLLGDKELENYRTHYVGAVLSDQEMMENITIEDNVKLGTAFGRVKPNKDVMNMLYDSLDLTSVIKEKAKNCTPTQRICAEIGRLMIKSPKVLLFDDFEDVLQADTMLRVWRVLKEISQTHLVIIVSNSQPYISKFADRVITIDNGYIVSDTGSDKRIKDNTLQKEILEKSVFVRKHRFTLSATGTLLKQVFSNFKNIVPTMLILLALAVGFVISSALSVFNMSQTIAKSSVERHENYIEFYKGNADNRTKLNYDSSVGETVIAQLQGWNLSFLMAKHEVNWKTNISNDFVVSSFITNSEVLKVGDKNKFGQELLAGTYTGSAAVGNLEENGSNVVISDYLAEIIIQNGLVGGFASSQNVTGELRNIDLYNALVSKDQSSVNFKMNGIQYYIVGIYKTDFDKYVDRNLNVKKDTKNIFEYNLKNIYSVIHVNTHFFTINARRTTFIESDSDEILVGTTNVNTYEKIFTDYTKFKIVNGASSYAVNEVGLGDKLNKTSTSIISNTDIYVSADILYQIYIKYKSDCPTLESFVTKYNTTGAKVASSSGVLNNVNLLKLKMGSVTLNIKGFVTDTSILKQIFVTGKTIPAKVNNSVRSEYEYLYIAKNYSTNGVVLPISNFTTSEIKTIIDTMKVNGDFSVNTLASSAIENVGGTISNLRFIFIILTVGLSVIMVWIMSRYVKKIFLDNAKTWGLVKAFGCTKLNLNVTIAIMSMLGILAVTLIGILFGWLITLLGNVIMLSSFGYAVSIFSINAILVIVFAVLMIGISGALVPFSCTEFQNLQPLYMIKYDSLILRKNVKKLEENNSNNGENIDNMSENNK